MAQQLLLLVQPNGSYKLTKISKKKKTLAKTAYLKAKIFFWNLSPLHWYEDFKTIHINMNEFISKKNK